MRLFLAINMNPALRREVAEATRSLREVAPAIGWVDEGRLHLTLKFLGVQPEESVSALTEMLDDLSRRHRQFAIRVRHVGAFPNFRRARVVWMGVEPDPRLELLHHDVEVACATLGFELEGRPFRPHLTLARVEHDRVDERTLRALWRASKRVDFEEETLVESIDLMHSTLSSSGSRYERVHASALRAS